MKIKNKRAASSFPFGIILFLLLLLILFALYSYFTEHNAPCSDINKTDCEYFKCKGDKAFLIPQSNNYYLQYQSCLLEKKIKQDSIKEQQEEISLP